MSKPPPWLAEALTQAHIADEIALTIDEVAWLRAHRQSGGRVWHPKFLWLYTKSQFRMLRRKTK